MPKKSPLNVSRRAWRRLLAKGWGKPGEPGGQPWFGEGLFFQHLTPTLTTMVGFCGLPVRRTSSQPIRTLIGITCPTCTRVAKRISRRIETENATRTTAEEVPTVTD